jgi:hypothetical protein
MAAGANQQAFTKVSTTKWLAYPYSHILVPGAGPDNSITPLSGEGMLRCRSAARAYYAGEAPFIVVSGGNVHPYKTKYNVAVEMRKYMIAKLHVPAYALMIDPHARQQQIIFEMGPQLPFR